MKKIYGLLICSAFALILTSCSSVNNNEQPPEIVKVKRVNPYHKVSDGDTVGSIATKYGMTRSELIKLNKLEVPYQLYNGQRLVVNPKTHNDDTKEIKVEESSVVTAINEDSAPKMEDHASELNETSDKEGGNKIDEKSKVEEEDKATIDDARVDTPESSEDVEVIPESEYEWPVADGKNKISQHFGDNDVDGGIIIDASVGTPVKAISDGVVMISGVPNGEASAYGVTVVIKHPLKKKMSIYANLKETSVKVGQKVKKGDLVGKVGKSGTVAKKPQLYFEVNDLAGKGRKSVDPEKLLSK